MADRQMTGLAGEFFVAAELLKRGIQTSITFGNAKAIDLLAHHPGTSHTFTIQVKALRKNNYFPLRRAAIVPHHTYVFVILNKPGVPVRYFVVPGTGLLQLPRDLSGLDHPTYPGIHPRTLKTYEDAWGVFERAPAGAQITQGSSANTD